MNQLAILKHEREWLRRLGKKLRKGTVPLTNDEPSKRRFSVVILLSWAARIDRKRWLVDLVRLALEIQSYNDKLAWRMCYALCEEYTKRIKEKDDD